MILDGHEVVATVSIGVALGTTAHARAEDLLRDADTALDRAKALGRARYEVFDQDMQVREVAQLALEMELRQAVASDQIRVRYQPIVSVGTGNVAGFEALARWQHPARGLLTPADFIPAAEESGLILELDHWMLREACRQAREWRNPDWELPFGVNVNLAGKGLSQRDLVTRVARTLRETGVDANRMCIEVTEGVLLEDVDAAGATLERLRGLDLAVSIDDFGTGRSCLSHLHRLPVDSLKIDRSFVAELARRRESAEIVRTIIQLGHNLGLRVVAEGVETEPQREVLRHLGCDYAQGYFYAPPMTAEAAQRLLALGRPLPA
jgi:EAL domain-containing protein (putative c-di-GMP-specific phosphodiesterase class I)